MPKCNAMTIYFDEITLFNQPVLFTPLRVDAATVPEGYYLYEVRHDDDCQGNAVQIAKSIIVNHWGSFITRDEIQLPPDGRLDINPDDFNYDIRDYRSIEEFMAKYPKIEKIIGNQPSLRTFAVTITETLKLTVNIEAENDDKAKQIVSDNWRNSEYILTADNFTDVDFEVVISE
ncbi:MAG: hypothetical protein LBR56_07000 [Sporomusaceae bacterium]|nr:hypothetical protein [Sporomusaceae bacterium]